MSLSHLSYGYFILSHFIIAPRTLEHSSFVNGVAYVLADEVTFRKNSDKILGQAKVMQRTCPTLSVSSTKSCMHSQRARPCLVLKQRVSANSERDVINCRCMTALEFTNEALPSLSISLDTCFSILGQFYGRAKVHHRFILLSFVLPTLPPVLIDDLSLHVLHGLLGIFCCSIFVTAHKTPKSILSQDISDNREGALLLYHTYSPVFVVESIRYCAFPEYGWSFGSPNAYLIFVVL